MVAAFGYQERIVPRCSTIERPKLFACGVKAEDVAIGEIRELFWQTKESKVWVTQRCVGLPYDGRACEVVGNSLFKIMTPADDRHIGRVFWTPIRLPQADYVALRLVLEAANIRSHTIQREHLRASPAPQNCGIYGRAFEQV
jgi:hypothetical protein